MQYEVFTLTLIMCCSNTPQWRLYVDLRWLNIWDGYRVDPERTERTCVSVCLNLNMLFVSNAVWGRNLTLMRYFVVQIHYNGNGDSCIDIKWMYATRCVELTLCKQWVRLNAYALEFEGFIGVWSSMLCSRNFTLLCCLNTTYNTWYYNGDCACLFVKYMERYHVGTGRTERAFQLLCVCVCVCVDTWIHLKALLVFETFWDCK